ncbi:hypothetical protein CUC04_10140 [Prevotella intermedia]|uniref:Uncharacterized protein n=1 Tax=Prevotella intermedia TaxID=28131 RepID=A0A2G9ID56_PREIN|nr:hypothetical protein CUC04_10140 [Prevotella intermedia]
MQGKSGSFASQKSRFRNVKTKLPFFKGIFFTKRERFQVSVWSRKMESYLSAVARYGNKIRWT